MRKKIGHRDCSPWAHSELTVSSRWPKWSQSAVTEPWPGPWLSCDLAVTEPWSYWGCCDWAVTLPRLSCDLAVTELWPLLRLSRDHWVRSRDHRGHSELTVSSRWQFFSHGLISRSQFPPMIYALDSQSLATVFIIILVFTSPRPLPCKNTRKGAGRCKHENDNKNSGKQLCLDCMK